MDFYKDFLNLPRFEDFYSQIFTDDEGVPYKHQTFKPSWLVNDNVNTIVRQAPSYGQLSINTYFSQLQVGLSAYSWGHSPSWYIENGNQRKLRVDIDNLKFKKCAEHEIRLYLLPPYVKDPKEALQLILEDALNFYNARMNGTLNQYWKETTIALPPKE